MALGNNISGLPLSYLKQYLTPQNAATAAVTYPMSLGGDLTLGMPGNSLASRLQAAQGLLGGRGGVGSMPLPTPPSGLIPAAESGVAEGAAPLGRIASFLAKTPFQDAAAGTGKAFGPGSLGRAGALGAGGVLASDLAGQLLYNGQEQNGGWDDFVRDSLKYGGIGAGLGTIFPGVGNVVGGLAGGALGVGVSALKDLAGWFGGPKDSKKTQISKETNTQNKKLATILQQLSPEAQQQVQAQLTLISNYATSPDEIKQGYMQVAQSLPAILAQEQQQKTQVANILDAKKKQYANLLAAQSLVAPMLDTYLQGLGADTKQFQKVSTSFADKLEGMNPVAADFLRTNSSRAVLSDDATRAAYLSQLGAQTQQLAASNDLNSSQAVAQLNAPMSIVKALQAQYGT